MSRLDELKAMSTDEIDCLVAENVMGWSPSPACTDWFPTTDHNDKAEILKEIAKRGLAVRFVKHLMDGVLPWLGADSYEFGNLFKLANATPRETCIAALLTVEGVK